MRQTIIVLALVVGMQGQSNPISTAPQGRQIISVVQKGVTWKPCISPDGTRMWCGTVDIPRTGAGHLLVIGFGSWERGCVGSPERLFCPSLPIPKELQ